MSALPLAELKRSTRTIASRYDAPADELYQEALIAAWREPGPLSYKIRTGNRRALSVAVSPVRMFGHPGGQRSGATPPRSALRNEVFDSDAVTRDTYQLDNPELRSAISALSHREQQCVYAIAFDMSPADSSEFMGITKGYFRQLRTQVLTKLRNSL